MPAGEGKTTAYRTGATNVPKPYKRPNNTSPDRPNAEWEDGGYLKCICFLSTIIKNYSNKNHSFLNAMYISMVIVLLMYRI